MSEAKKISVSMPVKTLDKAPAHFTQISLQKKSELIKYQQENEIKDLVHEFGKRKQVVMQQSVNATLEAKWFEMYQDLNNESNQQFPQKELLKTEIDLIAQLNVETAKATNTIAYWKKFMTEEELIVTLSLIIKRYIGQLKVNKNLTDIEIMVICTKLYSTERFFRIGELILMMYYVLTGKIPHSDFKIDESDFWKWKAAFNELEITHDEIEYSKTRINDSRPVLIDPLEKKAKEYEELQRAKKAINQQVFEGGNFNDQTAEQYTQG